MNGVAQIWNEVEKWAAEAGVLRVGSCPIDDLHSDVFREWIAAGHLGSMEYLRRHLIVREAPHERYPWARSAIAISVPYAPERPDDGSLASHVSRYAQGDDYHDVVSSMLESLESLVRSLAPEAKTWRYVDTGPLSDRAIGARAGLGWIGKNAMLIDEKNGSWFFIGFLLTSLEPDVIAGNPADRCGTCTRCIEACPTAAILPGRIVDSRRCISHATIEQRGALDDWMMERLEGNVFGCDICQEVCPWNRRAAAGHESLAPREAYRATPVSDLLRFEPPQFGETFRKSAVKRAKRAGLLRNAIAVAGGTLDDHELESLATHEDEGVRAAASWQLSRGKSVSRG